MKRIKKIISKSPIAALGGTLMLGLILGWLFFGGSGSSTTTDMATVEHSASEHEAGTTYTCSMHPQIREDEPGNCPICGMDLIPLTNEVAEGIDADAVVLSASAMKIADVETTVIKREAPFKEVVLPGMIKADERRIHELTSHFPGRIENLYVNFTGQKVRKGQVLATIFSPELVTAQKELFEAIRFKESNPQFYKASRNKLKLWLLTDQQIDEIEQSGEVQFYFKILSPGSGTVTKRNIAQGDHVKEGMSMFQIINLSHLWVEFDAYESDIPWIKMGSKVNISIKSIPGNIYKSKVTFIDPVLNEKSRTTVVRAELDNKSGELRPGMFAQASIQSMLSKNNAIMVPKSAVLWTGKKAVVYVREEHGESSAFHYREIILGEDTGTHYVVAQGLEEGEEVVTNGAFKIDAAAQLKGSQSMMNPEGGKQSLGGHEGMDMGGAEDKDEVKQASVFNIDDKFKAQLSTVVLSYLKLKDDFVATDVNRASKAAGKVKEAMENVKMELLMGDAHIMWMAMMKKIDQAVDKIIGNSDIEEQRLAFSDLSDEMYNTVKRFDVSGLNIYYQFCPMAKNDKGAFWLSLDAEIKNPYFGDVMLKCGETKETIK